MVITLINELFILYSTNKEIKFKLSDKEQRMLELKNWINIIDN